MTQKPIAELIVSTVDVRDMLITGPGSVQSVGGDFCLLILEYEDM
jgi:hypothetical protein